MFPRNKSICAPLLSVLLLAFAGLAAAQTDPQPDGSSLNTLSFTWSAAAGAPYVIALSTAPDFSVRQATGALSFLATTYVNLDQNTTYYFRAKSQSQSDAWYGSASSSTWAAAPSGAYFISSYFTAESSFTAVVKMGWAINGNPDWTRYDVSYADNSSFTGETVSPKTSPQGTPQDIGGLDSNTTYYFRVRARSVSGMVTDYTPPAGLSTATLAVKLTDITEDIFESSATIGWHAINDPAQALNSEGYRLHLSTTYLDMALNPPATTYWETASSDTASVELSPLTANTTYYYRAGALNWNGAASLFAEARAFTTLAPRPLGFVQIAVSSFSSTLSWTALADGAALGYRLEASSTDFFGAGDVMSAAAYTMAQNTLAVNGLDANTTYYFRTSSLNLNYAPNYTPRLSSITLASPPTANLTTIIPEAETITVFLLPLPASPQRSTCEGYLLEASSTAFGGTGVLVSSSTTDPQAGVLVLSGLKMNTPYNLRLATLNWAGAPNYSALDVTRTLLPPPPAGPQLARVWQSSAAVYFSGAPGGESYMVEASTYPNFNFIHRSSATTEVTVTTLAVTGLDANTPYYFRAGAVYNSTAVYANTTPAEQATLPLPLNPDTPPYAGVFYSSVTVSWTPLAGPLASDIAESYLLEAATTQAFTTVLFSSGTSLTGVDRLTLTGLEPNTTYYLRAGSVNSEGGANYVLTPATATLANPPVQQDFALTPYTMTLTWLPNSNPADTLYVAELDDNAAFSTPDSSATLLSSATFSGLTPNTTYYPRITAYNRFNRVTPTVIFSSMATGAFDPAFAVYSDIGVSSMTVNWSNGTNPLGVTSYRVQISSSQDHLGHLYGAVSSSVTANLYAVFYGLVSDASYYMQVSALNLTGVPTEPPLDLGAALTLPATAYILPHQQTFTARLTDGFTVNWADNGNSSFTAYNVQVSTRSDFSVMNSSLTVRALACSFKDLLTGTAYFVKIQARGQSGILSGYETAGSTMTLSSSTLNAVALQDSTISLETSYGTISVHIPRGAIGSSTRLTLSPVFSFPPPVSAVSELTPTGIGIAITHFPPTLVLDAITITLPYRLADLPPGTNRAKLILALYDETHAVWVPLPSSSDLPNNRVIGRTWHLSTFQIMQAASETGLGNVKIYPNPYMPNSVSDVMHFTNMTPYAKIRIYTFLGELVREVRADVNGMAHWDGLNGDGRKVASGVYIAFIQTQDKKNSKSFKVAVER